MTVPLLRVQNAAARLMFELRTSDLTWVALASCTRAYQVQAVLHCALSFLWQMSNSSDRHCAVV